ncbi:unnamed protein product [Nippostrongylus brasiliensis]|uniref:FNIP_M domain-containing protein n=1 Tax=Nippostrongylus brasiliensis TaxID=27835 RepID=A0A0N4XVT6_NIPBR|nr:unnamed protein product [Nippostrongylus brasiliensis]
MTLRLSVECRWYVYAQFVCCSKEEGDGKGGWAVVVGEEAVWPTAGGFIRLSFNVEESGVNEESESWREMFLKLSYSLAWQDFCSSICQLHNAPRLRHPVWLSLLERDHNENVVVADFCRQLTRLVEKLDTKHTKFFLSNVISTVLMHHMSWVASVSPPLHAPTHLHEKNPLVGSIFNDEAPYMPYNAQIAQYLEISGSVGSFQWFVLGSIAIWAG